MLNIFLKNKGFSNHSDWHLNYLNLKSFNLLHTSVVLYSNKDNNIDEELERRIKALREDDSIEKRIKALREENSIEEANSDKDIALTEEESENLLKNLEELKKSISNTNEEEISQEIDEI